MLICLAAGALFCPIGRLLNLAPPRPPLPPRQPARLIYSIRPEEGPLAFQLPRRLNDLKLLLRELI